MNFIRNQTRNRRRRIEERKVEKLSIRFEEFADPGNTDTLMEVIQEAEDDGLYELLDEDLHCIKYLVKLIIRWEDHHDEMMEAIIYLLDKVWDRDYTKYKHPKLFDNRQAASPRQKYKSQRYSALDVLTDALIEASQWDDLEISQLILDHGADPNYIDFYGATPLFYSGLKVTPLLLDRGARPDIKDFGGKTPFTYRLEGRDDGDREEEEHDSEVLDMIMRHYLENYGPNFEYGLKISGYYLPEIDLRGVVLRGADLSHTCLGSADLRGANLNYSNLDKVNLRGATMDSDTKIQSASFDGSRIDFHNLKYIGKWSHSVKVYVDPDKFEYTVPNVFLLFTLNLHNLKRFIKTSGTKFTYKAADVLEAYVASYRGESGVSYFDYDAVCNDRVLKGLVPEHNLKYFTGTGMVAVDDGFAHPTAGVYDDMDSITYRYFDICYRGETPNNIKYAKFLLFAIYDIMHYAPSNKRHLIL